MVKVLLIDDDQELLELVALALRRAGIRPLFASEPNRALECTIGEQPDLIVLDVDLGHSSGLDVLSAIRQKTSAPVLMLSGNTSGVTKTRARELGASDYLVKPVSSHELISHIRRLAPG